MPLRFLSLTLSLCFACFSPCLAKEFLPQSKTFIGKEKFEAIVKKAELEKWHTLSIGDRMVNIALQLKGVPYKGHTLEIDDHIESPSVNFHGLDCWTFFETVLCTARILEDRKSPHTTSKLLAEIENTRYRSGKCNGNYLDRIHYLMEWYLDNEKRKHVKNITKSFPHLEMPNRCEEMTKLWKYYRYLKHNPSLCSGMAKHEKRLTKMRFYMVPKDKVAAIEKDLKNGDIIGIARNGNGSYCSHVGIIVKDKAGKARFMHASTTYKKVVIDDTISAYLHKLKKHAGIVIARPR